MTTTVLSLGGSIVAPDKPDCEFLSAFKEAVEAYLDEDSERRLIIVTGGGAPARIYQNAARQVCDGIEDRKLDWLGIRSTHLNGELVKAVFQDYAEDTLVTNPTSDIVFSKRILVAAGWKPGFSTDTDAVYLAEKFGARLIINLSNIARVYTDDPKKNPDARPLDSISWDDFIAMVGTKWVPGKNTPFDPIASQKARDLGIKVICADGREIENTMAILRGDEFYGTIIGA